MCQCTCVYVDRSLARSLVRAWAWLSTAQRCTHPMDVVFLAETKASTLARGDQAAKLSPRAER